MPREEIEKIVAEVVKKAGASGISEMGKIIGEVMKETKGEADGKMVSEIVKARLQ